MIVIEAGRYFTETEFDGAELSGFDRLDLNGGGMASVEGSVGLLAGQGVGGTTLINCTFSFPHPRLRPEPGRSVGAHRREPRAQRAEQARRVDPRVARRAGLGMGGDAAQCRAAPRRSAGYGVKYEHVATPPSIRLSFSRWADATTPS